VDVLDVFVYVVQQVVKLIFKFVLTVATAHPTRNLVEFQHTPAEMSNIHCVWLALSTVDDVQLQQMIFI
jgi:hypothetical protein